MDTTKGRFTVFPRLPPELRNRIWAFAANNEPRTLDIWTDFTHCEVGDSTFFTQSYSTELSKPKLPSVLRTSRESRAEALKHYTYEFRTHMTLKCGITVIITPRIYVNYACDILIPRGFWNIVSFADFTDRITKKGLVHLAVDVDGSFWKENAKDYCGHGTWVLNSVQELMLYETTREKFWKESDYLDKFRKKYKGGPKLLEMVELEGERSQNVKDVEAYILKTFDKIEGKEEKLVEEDEEATTITKYPRYLDDCPKTEPEELRRPNITAKKLVTKPIYDDDD